ncbi:hypothetical protein FRC09_011288 [Ceratobasidium sp. 395]|nr:hypothetical protein FRC09_011288 [Ceratobasidium sp. 395]
MPKETTGVKATVRHKRAGRPSIEKENSRQKKRKNEAQAPSEDGQRSDDNCDPDDGEKEGGLDAGEELPLSQVWGDTIAKFFSSVDEQHHRPDEKAERLAELVLKHRIGGAYVQAFGPHHVGGIVDLKNRANPRQLIQAHVDRLVKAFRAPEGKSDHQSPILLMVSRQRIDHVCLANMEECDARDPTSRPPRLELTDECSDEIRRLEQEIFTHQQAKRWLTANELNDKKNRLNELYQQRPRAVLLNGNHRIEAVIKLGAQFYSEFEKLRNKVKKGKISPSEVQLEAQSPEMIYKAMLASYRVEVYDSDSMSEELKHWLVRNEAVRPTEGMGPGEKAWWMAGRFDQLLRKAASEGKGTRSEQANAAHAEWIRGLTMAATVEDGGQTVKSSARRKGDWAGGDSISRLFVEPLTTEMVLDIRNAHVAFERFMKHALSVAMIRPNGATLVCHFWLSARILSQIFDVAKGSGLVDACNYIRSHPRLSALGDPAAVEHWNNLHSTPQERPELLPFYTQDLSKMFDEAYCAVLDDCKHPTRGIAWGDGPVCLRVRDVFDVLGQKLLGRKYEWCQRVGASLCLYARLPERRRASDNPGFVAAAALPGERWLGRYLEVLKEAYPEAGLTMLEYALGQHLPMWTVGAKTVGTSVNSSNWYARSRAPHQIALRCTSVGPAPWLDLELCEIIQLLSDVRLPRSLEITHNACADELQELKKLCCVRRTGSPLFNILDNFKQDLVEQCGTYQDGLEAFHDGRVDVRRLITQDPPADPERIAHDMSTNCAFKVLVAHDFWLSSEAASWVHGWGSNRVYQEVNAMIGWGIFAKCLEGLFVQLMNKHPEARFLLHCSTEVGVIEGRRLWWQRLGVEDWDVPSAPQSEVDEDESGEDAQERAGGKPSGQPEDKEPSDQGDRSGRAGGRIESRESGGWDLERPQIPEQSKDRDSQSERSSSRGSNGGYRKARSSPAPNPPQTRASDPPTQDQAEPPTVDPRNGASRSASRSPALNDVSFSRPNPAIPNSQRTQWESQAWDIERQQACSGLSPAEVATAVGEQRSTNLSSRSGILVDITCYPRMTPMTAPTADPQTANVQVADIEDGDGYSDWLANRLPVHLFTRLEQSPNTLDTVLGRLVHQNPAPSGELKRAVELNEQGFDRCMGAIGRERMNLRESIVALAEVCQDIPYGGFLADTVLAGAYAQLKDIFVARVALLMVEDLEMETHDALNEAALVAVSDRLYETDIKRSGPGDENIVLDLTQTFAFGTQESVKEDGTLTVGPLPNSLKDRRVMLDSLQYFHAPRGPGSSEMEVFANGLESAVLVFTKYHSRFVDPESKHVAIRLKEPRGTSPYSQVKRWLEVPPMLLNALERLGVTRYEPDPSAKTRAPLEAGFSTGIFELPGLQAKDLSLEQKKLRLLASRAADGASTSWQQAQKLDVLSYRSFLDEFYEQRAEALQGRDSQVVPGSVEGERTTPKSILSPDGEPSVPIFSRAPIPAPAPSPLFSQVSNAARAGRLAPWMSGHFVAQPQPARRDKTPTPPPAPSPMFSPEGPARDGSEDSYQESTGSPYRPRGYRADAGRAYVPTDDEVTPLRNGSPDVSDWLDRVAPISSHVSVPPKRGRKD